MATLEKIRSKSVFLIIVIGVALLAFIIGDALTNTRNIFGDHTTVAKIGDTKIDYTEYQRKREELNNRYEEARKQNPEQYANFDTQTLPQMALDQLIQETLILNAAEKAGIRSSGNILRYYMLENPRNPYVGELMQQLQAAGLAAQTPQQAYDIIFNPKRNGLTDAQVEPLQRAWLAAEQKTEQIIKEQTYQRLLAGTVKANDLDRKALYDDYVNTSNVDVAFLPYGELNPKEYPVSNDELKAEYEKMKNSFKVNEPTKEIAFIAVQVAPSDADRLAANELAKRTERYMAQNPGALSKELKKEGVSMTHHALRAADITSNGIRQYVMAAPADSASVITQDSRGFTVVRMGKVTTQVDSIQINMVSAATEDAGRRVMAALNAGLPVDSLTVRFSPDSVMSQLNQWIPLFTAEGPTNALPQEQLDSLRNAGGKFIALQQGAQGMLMAQLVKQNAPVTVYDYDEAVFELGPSSKTLAAERDKLEKYLAANTTAKRFASNAAKAGYNVQTYAVTQSTPAIPRFAGMNSYYPDSRQVMRWVMIDGKENEVSHIYDSKSPTNPAMYAVAVVSEYDEYVPMDNKDIKEFLTQRVRSSKAGDKLVEKFSKKTQSLQSAAQAMGVATRNIPAFRFGQNPGVNDPGVVGKIAGTKADKKVVIAKGQDGIYVYQVMGKAAEKFPFNDQMYDQQYFQFINPDMISMIMGNVKYRNNIYKFEAGN